ncbi:MAG: hypothetical protein ABIT20_12700, partial [Gemmatimonadaceae bacterium]
MNTPSRFLSLAAVALIAACGSDSGTAPKSSAPVDLATAFTEMTLPGLSAAAALMGGVNLPSAGVPTGCNYVATSQSFVCPALAANGLSITSNYTLLDAAGHPMSQFDANTVSALRVRSTVAGALTVSGDNYNIDGQQDQTLSGLRTATHTLNGTNTLHVTGNRIGSAIAGAFDSRSTTTTTNVVLPAQDSGNSYPSSGNIAVDQTTSVAGGL